MKAVTKVAMGGVVLGALVSGQTAQALTRDQVRLRVLDQCVMTQSGKAEAEGAGPKCGCYAPKVVKLMTDEEVATFKKALPKRLIEDSNKIFATCK